VRQEEAADVALARCQPLLPDRDAGTGEVVRGGTVHGVEVVEDLRAVL
jgi:hypothetical protein